jgi:DNA-binding NtrC family response regulator
MDALVIRILLVDDEPDILTVISEYLKMSEFQVYPFSDPTKALDYFKQNPELFSLVLADIRMPGMNGIELSKRIVEIRPEMKILLMTAYEAVEKNLSDLPIVRYVDIIKKPFRLMEVCGAIKKQLHLVS